MTTTILVVENDRQDSRLIRDALREVEPDLNIRVELNGLDAVLYVKGEVKFADRNAYPFPDLILLDLGLPLFDGYEFLDWLRKNGPTNRRNTPVVVLTGSDRLEDISRAYTLGANSVITKPMNWNDFTEALAGVARFWSKSSGG